MCLLLTNMEVFPVVSQKHPLASRNTVTAKDIQDEIFLLPHNSSGTVQGLCEYLLKAGVHTPSEEQIMCPSCSANGLLDYMQEHSGMAFTAKAHLKHLNLQAVKILKLVPEPLRLPLCWVYRKDSQYTEILERCGGYFRRLAVKKELVS